MKRLFRLPIKYKKTVITVFALLSVVCIFLSGGVGTNYNMSDYLPKDSASTKALNKLSEEFGSGIPNVRVMVKDVTVPEALEYKEKIKQATGVTGIMWLDDVLDITIPLQMQEQSAVEQYYKDGAAVFDVTVSREDQVKSYNELLQIVGDKGALSGSLVDTASAMDASGREITKIMFFVIPLIFVILIFTTDSFIEPVLFLLTIGAAIVINNGTNIIFGEISFVTSASSSILQLAVSMDYSIFLLHRFSEQRKAGYDLSTAMENAISLSFSSITASGATTAIGFAALILMRFGLGADMGIVLTKGIIFSLISVLMLLPAMSLLCARLIDKTTHRSLMPSFRGLGKIVNKIKIPMVIIAVIVLIPCFLAQQQTGFLYGAGEIFGGETTKIGRDRTEINETFGKSNQMVLMIPKGETAKEKALCDEISDLDNVTSVLSYSATVGAEIPESYLDDDILSNFIGKTCSRIIITSNSDFESDEAFLLVEDLRALGEKYFPDDSYLAGESPSTYDIKNVVTADNTLVTVLSVVGIAIVLLLTFRSLSLPLILLFTIEGAIWINLSVPYFGGDKLFYIVYLIMSSIQLGATVDYAILFANRFYENRRLYDKKECVSKTVSDVFASILTSALILSLAGFCLGFMSTNGAISQIGMLLGRGALLSLGMTVLVLPALLYLLDPVVKRTTMNKKLLNGSKDKD